MEEKLNQIWVFNGAGGRFSSGVFSERDIAENWIKINKFTGVLTAYPLNIGTYDWAVNSGFFKPKNEKHQTTEFKQKFSSASQEHYHYEDGELD